MKSRLAVVALLLLLGAPAQAADEWSWVRAVPILGKSWWVTKGSGTIVVTGQSFKANLKVDPLTREGADIRLEGRIVGNNVTATAVYLETDAEPERLRGTIRKIQNRDGSVIETITFSGAWAGAFIGITRFQPSRPQSKR